MIRHVGIVLDTQWNFFHSAWPSKNSHGGRVENMYDEKVYNKISTLEQFYASRDPRNKI